MDLRQRTRRVRELVGEEAFDAIGIARLTAAATGASFRRWLGRGDHAGMAWLERRIARRLDPREILPGARTAVVVGWRYAPLEDVGDVAPTELWRRVARYARGADYHDFLLERLERTGERIAAAFPGTEHRAYVDTGAILERELAVRAGLGAIGKNTCLLSPSQGSWMLLGELLLTLDLEPDPPVADLCGDCSLCLEACPTGALPEPFRLDASRCISYWTIEHRGVVPRELRARVGEWVFGCDVCQEVCPWNRRQEPLPGRPEARVPEDLRTLDLVDLLTRPEAELSERLAGSPLLRPRVAGLRRNAAGTLGAIADPRAVPALAAALDDPQPVVRGQAAWALGEIGDATARTELLRALDGERDPTVREEIRVALGPEAQC